MRGKQVTIKVFKEARACTVCAEHLPLGPKPLIAGSDAARIVIIGQAPGRAAHASGVPWDDPSGDRLRDWMGVTRAVFDDPAKCAMLPMGFCYPGKGKSGDLPPRPECAPLWHEPILGAMPAVRLRIYIGRYAIQRYLGDRYRTLGDAARAYDELLPGAIALPHPSPRNNIWLKKNAWFLDGVVPRLRTRVRSALR